MAVVILCLIGMASADTYVGGLPLTTAAGTSGTVSGGVYMDADNDWWPTSPGVQEVEKTFTAIPDISDIEWARLYVAVYNGQMQTAYPGVVSVEFDGDGDAAYDDLSTSETLNVPFMFITNGGNDNSGFSGHGTGEPYKMVNEHCIRVTSDYVMWYDIDPADITSQNPMAHVTTTGTSIDGRIKLITLVIAYNDGDSDVIHYWVNQGQDAVTYYGDSEIPGEGPRTGSTNFDLSSFSGTVQSATLMVNHMASSDGFYWWIGDQLSRPADTYSQGAYFGWDSWDMTDKIVPGDINDLMYDRSCTGEGEYSGQFFKIPLAILTVKEEGAAPVMPVAAFSADVTSGYTPLAVQFTDSSTGPPTSWQWHYRYKPTGSTSYGSYTLFSTEQNPVNTFTGTGMYTIRLRATNSLGYDDEIKTGYITVDPAPLSDLDITAMRVADSNGISVFAKETNWVKVTVKNIGGSATTATTLTLTPSDGSTLTETLPVIAAGAETTITFTDSAIRPTAGGSVTYTATADAAGTVTEADETNNGATGTYTVNYNGYQTY